MSTRMSAEQYVAAMAKLGLTHAGAAEFLDVNEATSRRWARGARRVDPPAARLLAFMLAYDLTVDEVMRVVTRHTPDTSYVRMAMGMPPENH